MSDIFISYARDDRARIRKLAAALAAEGWTVWWDQQLPYGGQPFRVVIEEHLTQSKCIIVAWTYNSVKSTWVLDEASHAAKREVLVPIMLDDVQIPLGFQQFNAADLTTWNGQNDDIAFGNLANNIRLVVSSTNKKQQNHSVVIRVTKTALSKVRHIMDDIFTVPTILFAILVGALEWVIIDDIHRATISNLEMQLREEKEENVAHSTPRIPTSDEVARIIKLCTADASPAMLVDITLALVSAVELDKLPQPLERGFRADSMRAESKPFEQRFLDNIEPPQRDEAYKIYSECLRLILNSGQTERSYTPSDAIEDAFNNGR